MFLKQTSNSLPLSPLGHSVGFASCKAWCVLISASLPKTPFPGERLCMLCRLCIVQSFGHTRPASLPGLNVGLPPLDQARMLAVSHTKPLHDAVAQMADDLYGGLRPKARTLWLLAKSFARCKTNKASNARHPIFK